MHALERIMKRLAGGNHEVLVDDTEALVHTIS